MPWSPEDAKKYTKKAKSPAARRQWMHVANGVLAKTGDEGKAIQAANSVIARRGAPKKKAWAAANATPSWSD